MKHSALVLLAFAATACTANDAPVPADATGVREPAVTDYLCGATFARASFATNRLTLDVGDRRYLLASARSASGARYASTTPPVEFWEHQGEATLTLDGERLPTCIPEPHGDLTAFVTGREWVVEDIAGGGVIDFARLTMTFAADGTLSGLAGCNRYSGRYTLDQRRITTAQLASTRKACAPALMNQETAFLALLESAVGAAPAEHGALVIESAAGDRLLAR